MQPTIPAFGALEVQSAAAMMGVCVVGAGMFTGFEVCIAKLQRQV